MDIAMVIVESHVPCLFVKDWRTTPQITFCRNVLYRAR